MKSLSRLLAILAILSTGLLFFFPLWQITLAAPQYPDGISMYIWIYKITGDTEYTLQNINILNHYVGMKYIEPESIPELKYFPFVTGFIMLFGVVAAWLNNRKVYLVWFLVFLVLAILGIYDFYLWEYDYGHNLSPTAPIKVPGQSYQPPLIGVKYLLNFRSESWPGIGGIGMGIAILLSFLAFWRSKKTTR